MIDTKNIQMCLQARIRMVDPATGNLADLPAQDNVVPYNGFLYTFWKVFIMIKIVLSFQLLLLLLLL
jgi:tetrahydromethanopterin S-methyltransferase subunit B